MKKTAVTILSIFIMALPAFSNEDIKPAWQKYSEGLHYKNMALDSNGIAEKKEFIKKALELFLEALNAGDSPDELEPYAVYSEIADCYYYLRDFSNSSDYAEKAIAGKKDFLSPYNRLFNIHLAKKEYKEAAEVLENYLSAVPDSPYVIFILAEHYYARLNDAEKAEQHFNRILSYEETAVESRLRDLAFYYMGNIYFSRNMPDEALEYYFNSIAVNGENHNSLYMASLILMSRYRFDEALGFALQYLQLNPETPEINGIAGRAKYAMGHYDAKSYLYKAAQGNTPDALLALGLYYELIGSNGFAEKMIIKASGSSSDFVTPRIAMGNLHLKKNDDRQAFNEYISAAIALYESGADSEALKYLNKAEKLNDSFHQLYLYKAKIHERGGNLSMAIHCYREALRLNLDINTVLYTGYLHSVKGEYAQADEYFHWALDIDPVNAPAHFYIGLSSIWMEKYSDAENSIKKSIELGGEDETYYYYLAVAQERLGKFEETVSSLENALRLDPESARSNNFLGYLYADKNIRLEESYRLINKALELEPGNAAYIDSMGWYLFREKKYPEALEKLLLAEELLKKINTEDAEVFSHIGDTYLALGDSIKALYYWERSQQIKWNEETEKKIKRMKK